MSEENISIKIEDEFDKDIAYENARGLTYDEAGRFKNFFKRCRKCGIMREEIDFFTRYKGPKRGMLPNCLICREYEKIYRGLRKNGVCNVKSDLVNAMDKMINSGIDIMDLEKNMKKKFPGGWNDKTYREENNRGKRKRDDEICKEGSSKKRNTTDDDNSLIFSRKSKQNDDKK